MIWTLKITAGRRQGENFALRDGLTIGRKKADVTLDDPRVSTLHASVSGGPGTWVLHDNGSKNGLKDARGRVVDRLELKVGVEFSVGDSKFVVEGPARTTTPARPAPPPPVEAATLAMAVKAPKTAAPPPAVPTPARRTWNDVLAQTLIDHAERFKDRPRGLTPFEPALVLEFTRGPQVNAKWILGYGPRRVGPAALDLPLWDVDLPPVCFEILPSKDGLIFRTEHRELVRLNDRSIDTDVLRAGDLIQIRDTLIEVDFTA